jgi:hypothetical protein
VQYRSNKNTYLTIKGKSAKSVKHLEKNFSKFVPRKQSNFMPKYFPRRVKRPTLNHLSPQGVLRSHCLRKSYEERTFYF